jgi:hypothetical protein
MARPIATRWRSPPERALGLPLQELLDLEGLRGVPNALGDLVLRHPVQLQTEREVVFDRHVWVERVVLEDHRDVALLRRDIVDDAVADPELAARDLLERSRHAERRRLAASGWADEHHHLPVFDLQVEVRDGPPCRRRRPSRPFF